MMTRMVISSENVREQLFFFVCFFQNATMCSTCLMEPKYSSSQEGNVQKWDGEYGLPYSEN
jgi:hypothetical protein